jgi:Domain of unknown function (DUF3291)
MRTPSVVPNHSFHLAEFNISRLKAPLDDPSMREFVDFLAPVNAFADGSPGFVWRLDAGDGVGSTYLPPSYDDPMVITNLSVWTDLESLRVFAYETVHRYFLQSRRKWFDRVAGKHVVLWWVPAGQIPTLDEGGGGVGGLGGGGGGGGGFTFHDAFDSTGKPVPRAARPGHGDEP